MPITKALEFDQTPNKLLFEIGEQARQQALLRQKLEKENNDKRLQLLGEINGASLSPKFEKEVINAGMSGLLNNISTFLNENPNASDVDLRMQINKGIGSMAEWSAKTKIVKDNIESTIQNMDRDAPFDKGRLRALAIDRALYKTDQFGRKLLKPAEEIDVESDIVSSIANNEPDKVIDAFKGQDIATKLINDASLFTQNVENTIETPDGRKTVVTGQKSSVPFYLEPANGTLRVKQQKDGYIDEDVYQRFYKNPAMKVWIDANAKTIMDKGRVPESPEAAEWFRRSFLTNWLDQNKKGVIDKVDKTLYQKPINFNIGGSVSSKDGGFMDIYKEINEAANSGKQVRELQNGKVTKIYGAAVNQMTPAAQSYLVGIANSFGKKKSDEGEQIDFNQGDLVVKNDNGVLGLYEYPSGNLISSLNDVQTNVKSNPTAKTKQKAIDAASNKQSMYIIGGKEYGINDLIKIGYTQAQIDQAVKLGTVKIK